MMQKYKDYFWPLLILGTLFSWLAGYLAHGLFPIDETRYVAIAWEMWHQHSFALPILNGQAYSHKPPLLFWLIQLGWQFLGVNDWWPRLVPLIFSLASLALVARLNTLLFPQGKQTARYAVLILASSWAWILDSSLVMFDIILTFFILLAVLGSTLAIIQQKKWGWLLYSIGLACGLLTKGPACFIYILSFSILLICFANQSSRMKQASLLFASTLLGIAFASLWIAALFSAIGDTTYLYHLLWTQTAHRVVKSFAHQHPFWWYLPLLILLFLPWSLIPKTWQVIRNYPSLWQDWTTRLLCGWILIPLAIFSAISGKQIHYLIPMLPAWSLLLANRMNLNITKKDLIAPVLFVIFIAIILIGVNFFHLKASLTWLQHIPLLALSALIALAIWLLLDIGLSPFIKMTFFSLIFIALLQITLGGTAYQNYNTHLVGKLLKEYEIQHRPIGFFGGHYAGEFNFYGRLQQPILSFSRKEISSWIQAYPQGVLIIAMRQSDRNAKEKSLHFQSYRGQYLGLWSSEQLNTDPRLMHFLMQAGDGDRVKDQVD